MYPAFTPGGQAYAFAQNCNFDVLDGLKNRAVLPVLMPIDNYGRPLVHLTQTHGVDFYASRIDFFGMDFHVVASRAISMILPGYRSHSAYLPADARPKLIEVHKGLGSLVISGPKGEDDDNFASIFPLDPAITPVVTIAPGSFYTFEAKRWNDEPLVISELASEESSGSLRHPEIQIEAYQEFVETDSGLVYLPDDFYTANFA